MADLELRNVVNDLIGVLHDQAKQIEAMAVHLEQVAGRLPDHEHLSIATSELSELRLRMKKLSQAKVPGPS